MSEPEIQKAVRLALEEDLGSGDVTTIATIPEDATSRAVMRAREPLVLAGIRLAEAAFRELAPDIQLSRQSADGARVPVDGVILEIAGSARAILSAERVALNFVQRLSAIATLTAQYVEAIQGTRAQILDTRKTTPGWRTLEKYAVTCGGGKSHRFGLFDMILIKDNHLSALAQVSTNPVGAAVHAAREKYPNLKVEVEADTLEQVEQALAAKADIVLLDNMNPVQLRLAVRMCKGKAKTEASGGINLGSVRTVADTGVDLISVGALTHSARAVDIGLDFER